MKRKTKRRLIITGISFIAILVVLAGAFYLYTKDYYRAEAVALQIITDEQQVTKVDNMWIFHADETTDRGAGLIFYPGGKVEAVAYAPLLRQLAQHGVTSILIDMPFNLAMFDINAADRVYDQFPDIERWYLAGHSLGGAMAGIYASGNEDQLDGLILLGSYLTDEPVMETIAIYGSEDRVLNKEKLSSIPKQYRYEISGGNHANFGDYGEQKGDGNALISREQQQLQTVQRMLSFIDHSAM